MAHGSRSGRLARVAALGAAFLVACAGDRPPGPAPSARIASLEPRLAGGQLVVRFEITNEGEVPIALIDGLAAAQPDPDPSAVLFDPCLEAAPAADDAATLELRKGALPTPWQALFLVARLPVLKTIAPGERFSDVARIVAPAAAFERVRLVLDVVANVPLEEQQTAEGPVLSAPLSSLAAARWRLTSDATPLVGYAPIGVGTDEAPPAE
ncbi:MAG TPA: hypothetical protein VMW35_10290 [Myxococcota bacterium]|nr:hypothetical protein [Myxococcota bacterium]